MYRQLCFVGLFLLLFVQGSNATTIFSDRSIFESALDSFIIENFENSTVTGTPDGGATASAIFGAFTVSSLPLAVKILETPFFGAGNTTIGGSRYLCLDTDIFYQGSVSTFMFSEPVRGFGFDYTQLNQPATMPVITIASDVFPMALNPTPFEKVNPLFWGIISDMPFLSVTIDSGIDSGYGIDQLTMSTTAPIPEPSTALLIGVGVIGLLGGYCRGLLPGATYRNR